MNFRCHPNLSAALALRRHGLVLRGKAKSPHAHQQAGSLLQGTILDDPNLSEEARAEIEAVLQEDFASEELLRRTEAAEQRKFFEAQAKKHAGTRRLLRDQRRAYHLAALSPAALVGLVTSSAIAQRLVPAVLHVLASTWGAATEGSRWSWPPPSLVITPGGRFLPSANLTPRVLGQRPQIACA